MFCIQSAVQQQFVKPKKVISSALMQVVLLQRRDSAKFDFMPDVNGLLHSSHWYETVCACVCMCEGFGSRSSSTSVQESELVYKEV